MKNKKDKLYLKAIRYYEEGEIDKALSFCEKCINVNLRNTAALNLKGLLLYLKGDLQGAISQWKINSDYNDDSLAKMYINDSKNDSDKLNLYKEGEKYLKSLAIEDAIYILKKCAVSDFNAIKVNLALAIAYSKKGDYATSSVYVTKVLKIDKNNTTAKSLASEIEKLQGVKLNTVVKTSTSIVKPILVSIIAVTIVVLCVFGYQAIRKPLDKKDIISEEALSQLNEEVKPQITPEENDIEVKGENKVDNLVNFDELSSLIKDGSIEKVYESYIKIDNANLNSKEKTIYLKAKELLEKDGVSYFYKKGSENYSANNYKDAKIYFEKSSTIGKNNYLYQHILFFSAATNEKLGDTDKAIKEYEEYYKNYKKETYIVETTYKLALLYKDINIDLSILYAKEIRDNYSSSIYNNKVISDLLDATNK